MTVIDIQCGKVATIITQSQKSELELELGKRAGGKKNNAW